MATAEKLKEKHAEMAAPTASGLLPELQFLHQKELTAAELKGLCEALGLEAGGVHGKRKDALSAASRPTPLRPMTTRLNWIGPRGTTPRRWRNAACSATSSTKKIKSFDHEPLAADGINKLTFNNDRLGCCHPLERRNKTSLTCLSRTLTQLWTKVQCVLQTLCTIVGIVGEYRRDTGKMPVARRRIQRRKDARGFGKHGKALRWHVVQLHVDHGWSAERICTNLRLISPVTDEVKVQIRSGLKQIVFEDGTEAYECCGGREHAKQPNLPRAAPFRGYFPGGLSKYTDRQGVQGSDGRLANFAEVVGQTIAAALTRATDPSRTKPRRLSELTDGADVTDLAQDLLARIRKADGGGRSLAVVLEVALDNNDVDSNLIRWFERTAKQVSRAADAEAAKDVAATNLFEYAAALLGWKPP
ncbi:hypothetical protein M885DRAFT_500928 [Pelagophyceae sp. CCMP2097]|nr:hypothetical protein M885DRAFT_500928 [Pelagophyceae sp. CCMP2097]